MSRVVVIEGEKGQTWTVSPPDLNLEAIATFLDEFRAAAPGDSACLLVTVFAASRTTVLLDVLSVFLDGVTVEVEDAKIVRVPFSILGVLTSTVASAVTLTFVVRPAAFPHTPIRDVPAEDMRIALQRALDRTAEVHHPADDATDVWAKVWTLTEATGSGLFAGKSFHEMRFGIVHRSLPETGAALSKIAAEITKLLGSWGIPIAYLLFPFEWPSLAGGPLRPLGNLATRMRWLRVAVGMPYGLTEPIEVQLAARRIALSNEAVLCLYNAASRAAHMGERFDLVAVSEQIRSQLRPNESSNADESTDVYIPSVGCVFAESKARPGLVAHILSVYPNDAESLVGCSMTVLQGHTVAALVIPVEGVPSLFEAVERRLTDEPAHRTTPLSRLPGPQTATGGASDDATIETIWLAWRVPDQPGVVRAILQALHEHAASHPGRPQIDRGESFWSSLQVDYLIGRVLADGVTCAGKMKLCAEPVVAGVLNDRHLLEHLIKTQLLTGHDEWSPTSDSWRERPIIISTEEPAEEPWASLVLEAVTT